LAASFYFDGLNFKGIAKFLRAESNEERTHGLAFSDYLIKRSAKPVLCTLVCGLILTIFLERMVERERCE
jgi:ferritin